MALKDWEKEGYASEGGAWKHKTKHRNLTLIVDSYENENPKWWIILQKYSPSSGSNQRVLKKVSTKSQALQYARSYMMRN